jgi:hypothetical protein
MLYQPVTNNITLVKFNHGKAFDSFAVPALSEVLIADVQQINLRNISGNYEFCVLAILVRTF